MRRGWVAVTAASLVVLTACSGGSGHSAPAAAAEAVSPTDPAKVSGEITVLTNRTDQLSDGTLKNYAAEFNKTYPNVTVKFEAITDYEGEVKIRMNTENYGDVLLIPNNVPITEYAEFFSPLGDAADLSKTYQWTDYATVAGKVYGIANYGTASGFVYNKTVWKQAGLTDWPTTQAQFVDDLKAIKAKTQATPYYTNYHDGWPLQQWSNAIGSASCDPAAKDALAKDTSPWSSGKDLNAIDSLLYTTVNSKLTEADPTTTNWENSKTLMGTGKVATMFLGSWAVPQMQAAAKTAGQSPDSIGFMPFPQAGADGKLCTVVQPDYKYAVNVHSKHKDASRAWLDWYINKSGSAQAEQAISSVKGTALPSDLQPFEQQGVKMIGQNQTQAATVSKIDKGSEIGLDSPDYRQKLVDIARGAGSGDQNSYFADLNKKWAASQQTVTG
ncbi:ABC transporter substrate-binding protein [Kitasatospora sp. NPDC058965]|uniref:ABC transporter substrate-binding protein n=1 Tax=Kitasatospora sp. NPDC058965 TaxID=3346682 RepID=UPI003691EB62